MFKIVSGVTTNKHWKDYRGYLLTELAKWYDARFEDGCVPKNDIDDIRKKQLIEFLKDIQETKLYYI